MANSPSVLRQIQKWVSKCQESHIICNRRNWAEGLPKRLLEIQGNESTVQLIKSGSLLPGTKYVSLSYCWGDSRTANTTLGNLVGRSSQAFSAAVLPATIRDAVAFTFWLGLRYIWVDAVCIVQDWDEDRHEESGRMDEIYSNAHFTLSALAASSGDEGLFSRRDAWTHPLVPPFLSNWIINHERMTFRRLKEKAPWSKRGWTLQEELLSPRTLYIAASRVYWVCGEGRQVEQPEGQALSEKCDEHEEPARDFFHGSELGQELSGRWHRVVESYSSRILSQRGDRLVALSGLATRYLTLRPDDTYIAGLWKENFGDCLAWRCSGPAKRETYKEDSDKLPSWSWASLPVGTSVYTAHNYSSEKRYDFGATSPRSPSSSQSMKTALFYISEGNEVRSITLRGKVRPICSTNSTLIHDRGVYTFKLEWGGPEPRLLRRTKSLNSVALREVVWMVEPMVDHHCGREIHTIESQGDSDVLKLYEPGQDPMTCHLDYVDDILEIAAKPSAILGLKIGDSSMLLLKHQQSLTAEDEEPTMTRVGICRDVRVGFFDEAEEIYVILA